MIGKISHKISKLCLAVMASALLWSCYDDGEKVTAVLSGSATILRGDTAEVRIDFTGTPPYGFRYSDGSKETNIIDIETTPYIMKVVPTQSVEYTAVAVATLDRNIGHAIGSANIEVLPVTYVTDQTLETSATFFVYRQNDTGKDAAELELSNNGNYTRNVFFEFDISDIETLEDYNRYTLRFWIARTHTNAVSKDAMLQIKGLVGSLNTSWIWSTQPAETDLTTLFNTSTFKAAAASDTFKFEGDVSVLVKQALQAGEDKIVLRVNETTANKSLYYIAGKTYTTQSMRPAIDVKLRRLNN